jgi:hypothetical protein
MAENGKHHNCPFGDLNDLDFTWDLGIGIWNFWNDSQIDRLKILLKLDLFTTNSAVQGLARAWRAGLLGQRVPPSKSALSRVNQKNTTPLHLN